MPEQALGGISGGVYSEAKLVKPTKFSHTHVREGWMWARDSQH